MPLVVASAVVVFGAVIWANAYQTQQLAVLYLGQVAYSHSSTLISSYPVSLSLHLLLTLS